MFGGRVKLTKPNPIKRVSFVAFGGGGGGGGGDDDQAKDGGLE